MKGDPLAERIKEDLLRATRAGTGITEQKLCRTHTVSRGRLRESLEHLKRQGIVEQRRKKGTFLRKLSVRELGELWDLRTCLEGFAARLACLNGGSKDFGAFDEIVRRRKRAGEAGDERAADELDIEFHSRLVDVAGSALLRSTVANLGFFHRIFDVHYPAPSFSVRYERLSCSHQRILDALKARDADRAERLVRQHIQAGKKHRMESLAGWMNPFEK